MIESKLVCELPIPPEYVFEIDRTTSEELLIDFSAIDKETSK